MSSVVRVVGGVVGTVIGFYTGQGWLVSASVALAMGGAQEMLMRRPRISQPGDPFRDLSVNVSDPVGALPIIYGEMTVGVHRVWAHTEDEVVDGVTVKNRFLYLLCAVAHGPVKGMPLLLVDGLPALEATGNRFRSPIAPGVNEEWFDLVHAQWASGTDGQLAVIPTTDPRTVSTAVPGAAELRVVTTTAHPFQQGDVVRLSGTSVSGYNLQGGYTVSVIESTTQFRLRPRPGQSVVANATGGTVDFYNMDPANLNGGAGPAWGSKRWGKGVAHVLVRLRYDDTRHNGQVPRIEVTVQGRAIKDTRSVTTLTISSIAAGPARAGYASTTDINFTTAHGLAVGAQLLIAGAGYQRVDEVVDSDTVRVYAQTFGSDTSWSDSDETASDATAGNGFTAAAGQCRNPIDLSAGKATDGKYKIYAKIELGVTGGGTATFDGRIRAYYKRDGETRVDAGVIATTGQTNYGGNTGLVAITPTEITVPDNGYGSLEIDLVPEVNLIAIVTGTPTVHCRVNTATAPDNQIEFKVATVPGSTAEVLTYSTNPPMVVRDYLTSTRYGAAVPVAELDETALQTEANYCDELVVSKVPFFPTRKPIVSVGTTNPATINTGGAHGLSTGNTVRIWNQANAALNGTWTVTVTDSDTFTIAVNNTGGTTTGGGFVQMARNVARYSANAALSPAETLKTNLEKLLTSYRAQMVYQGGLYRTWTRRVAYPGAFELTPRNMIPGTFRARRPGFREVANHIRAAYYEMNRTGFTVRRGPDFVEWPSAVGYTNAELTEDAGFESMHDVDLPCTTDAFIAEQIAQIARAESRAGTIVGCTVMQDALVLAVGDLVPVTHDTSSFSRKKFWVLNIALMPDGLVRLTLLEYSPTAYSTRWYPDE